MPGTILYLAAVFSWGALRALTSEARGGSPCGCSPPCPVPASACGALTPWPQVSPRCPQGRAAQPRSIFLGDARDEGVMTATASDLDLDLIRALRQLIASEPDPRVRFTPEQAKELLASNHLSYETAARVLGCSWWSVQGWLRGEHSPRGDLARRWERLLALLNRRREEVAA